MSNHLDDTLAQELAASSKMNDCLKLTEDLTLGDLMMNISINNEAIWGEETTVWLAFFYLYVAIFIILFGLLTALTLYVVTQRKRSERQKLKKVNTFYAINSLIIALGVLRIVHLIFDPHNVEGWIEGPVPRHILSVIFSMGFPSLTASYLLVFITLWMSRKIQGGFKCIQKLTILIPLCAFQYVVTFIVEMTTITNQYEIIYLIIGCDLFFSVWGIVICVCFLLAGYLLIKSIGVGNRNSTAGLENLQTGQGDSLKGRRYTHGSRLGVRRFTFTKRQNSTLSYKRKGVEHRQRAMMKVTIVTCVTAVLAILYGSLYTVNVAMAMDLLFQKECVNEARGNRAVWLFLLYIGRTLEILLCLLLLYAVADTTKMMKYLFRKCKKLGCIDDDTVDLNTTDYDRTMSELETSTAEKNEVALNSIKTKSDNNVDGTRVRLPSVTEETIHYPENGDVVEDKSKQNATIENGTTGNVPTENGTINNHGLLHHRASGPVLGQYDTNSTLLSVKQQLPKSHSDSSIMPNGKQTTEQHKSNEIL